MSRPSQLRPWLVLLLAILATTIVTEWPYLQRARALDLSFSPPINLSNNLSTSETSKLAAAGDFVYAVWADDVSGNSEILFRSSNSNGATFGPTINLSNNIGISTNPQIAASGSSVYVVWVDDANGVDTDILYRASNTNGASFSATQDLSADGRDSALPWIASIGTNVYLIWENDAGPGPEIDFRASVDNGAVFGTKIRLSTSPEPLCCFADPKLAAAGNNVYATWRENDEAYFAVSNNNGLSFGTKVNLSNNGGISLHQQIGAVGSNVYLAWEDDTGATDFDILFRSSTNNGGVFGSTANLSTNPSFSGFPQLTTTGSSVYVVWQDFLGNMEVLLRASNDNGVSFASPVNLSNNIGFSSYPQVSAFGSNVYTVWNDDSAGNGDVFFRASSDGGTSFGTTNNLSNNLGLSTTESATLVTVGNLVYVAWRDDDPGNDEILFRASVGFHNVKVVSVVSAKTVIGVGQSGDIVVNVSNTGQFTELVTVRAYAGGVEVGTSTVTIPPGSSGASTLLWVTSGFGVGTYQVSASASIVPVESDPSDNIGTDGLVKVTTPGDIDGDGDVDLDDVLLVAIAWGGGGTPGMSNWNPNADMDNDHDVDIDDVLFVAIRWT